jgi:hypothetical protein
MSGRDKLHEDLTSSSKRGTDLIDLTSNAPKDVNFERSLSRTDTRKRRLPDSSNHQDGITDLSDQDQRSLEATGRKRGRLNRNDIAKPTFGMAESKDEQLHYEKRPSRSAASENIGIGSDDELALNPSRSQRQESSSNAHFRSIAAARHIPMNLISSLSRIGGFLTGQTSSPPLSRTGSLRDPNREIPDMTSLVEELRAKDKTLEKYSKYYNKLNHKYEELKEEVKHMAEEEHELERQNQFLLQQRGETVLQCQTVLAEARRLEAALSSVQEKYEALIRKQQEESFKQMSTARWLPIEDSKIVGHLDRFKREMRSWAKASAVKDLESLEKLDLCEHSDLSWELSKVAVLQNGRLPDGLPTPKVAALLLNALLAHHLYTSIFKSPFFCLEYGYGDDGSAGVGAALFEKIYQVAQNGKQNICIRNPRGMLTLLQLAKKMRMRGAVKPYDFYFQLWWQIEKKEKDLYALLQRRTLPRCLSGMPWILFREQLGIFLTPRKTMKL